MSHASLTNAELASKLTANGLMVGGDLAELLREAAHRLDPDTGLEIDHDREIVTWNGREVPLTGARFRVVALLASKPGKLFTYAEVYVAQRGDDFRSAKSSQWACARSAIKRIRQDFHKVDRKFDRITNLRDIGYAWMAK